MHKSSFSRRFLGRTSGLVALAILLLTPLGAALACPTFKSCGPVMIEEDPDRLN